MNHELTLIIERDPESGWLVASIAEVSGCYSQAPNVSELLDNIREAVLVYLETVQA